MSAKKSLLSEFKVFISRGNVIDLAVGIIVGSAFTGVVNSLVKEVLMPPIGLIVGRVTFTDLRFILQPADAATSTPEVAILYGSFLQQLLNFFIVAVVVFSLVKAVNTLKRDKEAESTKPKKKELTEIDLLKKIEQALRKKR